MTLPPGAEIPLDWDGDAPDFWAVRGHVPFEGLPDGEVDPATAWALEWFAMEDRDPPERGFRVRHCWARWCWMSGLSWRFDTDDFGRLRSFVLQSSPGRGAFPVTVATDRDEEARRADWRAWVAQREPEVRAEVARRWPECQIERVDVMETSSRVQFMFPGGRYVATYVTTDDHVLVAHCDVEAWNAYRTSRTEA